MDVLSLTESIKVKGDLTSRNDCNELEIMNLMNEINYGWIDKNSVLHKEVDYLFSDHYILPTPTEVLKNKVGVCWDQVELERYYFENTDWNIKTYFIVYYDNDKCPTHTFLTFKRNGKYYWFEHSLNMFRGIHQYSSIKELLIDVRCKFIEYELNNNYNQNNLAIHEYKKPEFHISVQQFYEYCESEPYIDLDN